MTGLFLHVSLPCFLFHFLLVFFQGNASCCGAIPSRGVHDRRGGSGCHLSPPLATDFPIPQLAGISCFPAPTYHHEYMLRRQVAHSNIYWWMMCFNSLTDYRSIVRRCDICAPGRMYVSAPIEQRGSRLPQYEIGTPLASSNMSLHGQVEIDREVQELPTNHKEMLFEFYPQPPSQMDAHCAIPSS
ncbi:hypothetical protein MSAN_01893700 [Mycena sanguinolenta]|uniref:Uncharacterized protein n=1 Tax=Mycena sanguinolenta TaxID=230812 RepID=A0A8H7CPB6_9AGAR|nr:hypothetical protein MSAN_01893700 [Mycena sanguinolenta]